MATYIARRIGKQHTYAEGYAYLQTTIGIVEQNYTNNYSVVDIIVKNYFSRGLVVIRNIANATYELSSLADSELTAYFAANGGVGTFTGGTFPYETNTNTDTNFESDNGVVFKKRFQINHDENGEAKLDFLQFKLSLTIDYGAEGTTSLTLTTLDDFILPAMDRNMIPAITATYPSHVGLMTDEAELGIYVDNRSMYVQKMEAVVKVSDKALGEEFEVHRVTLSNGFKGTHYFDITEDERNAMRYFLRNTEGFDYHFYLYMTINGQSAERKVTRDAHIANCNPVLANPTVIDANSTTAALTGDVNVLVYGESNAEYSVDVGLRKEAYIKQFSVTNGSQKASLPQGLLQNVESGLFTFDLTDSRGKVATASVEKTLIPYLKPTCYIQVEVELVEETAVVVHFRANGSVFRGNFGAVDNAFKIEIRHTQNDGNMGEWTDITPIGAIFKGNSYEITTTITGLIYRQTYDFQLRITDSLYTVQSATYTAVLEPVFDWGEQDFNFNVPVSMNGKPVLRHNRDGNHTIISASGGRIHLRPNGTDDETGQFVIYPDVAPVGGCDYVIETGKEPMGTNGTWYWEKWASGKAVCWGTRNFGTASLGANDGTTAIFTAGYYTQDFPSGLFINAPIAMTSFDKRSDVSYPNPTWTTIRSISQSSMTFWLCSYVSGRISASDTSFHVIGRWREETA